MTSKVAALVSSAWLKQNLSHGRKNVKLLDASWTALKGGHEDYLSKHIPGASFFDLNHCVKSTPTLPRNLPDVSCFEEYCQSLGVSSQSHLVVYDRGGILPSARTWWTFRAYGHHQVSVLDGGLKIWEAAGHDTTSTDASPTSQEKGDFKVNIDQSLVKNFEDMIAVIKTNSSKIIDARRPEHFFGEEPEPTPFTEKALQGMGQPVPRTMVKGHLPNAINILEDLVLDPRTNCLLPKQQLLTLFSDYGINLSHPLTAMCYNGHAATLLALAAHVCGKDDTSVYYGSWTEWGQRAGPDLVTGSSVAPPAG